MLRFPVLALIAGFVLLGGIVASIAIFALSLQASNASLTEGLQRNILLSQLLIEVQGAETGQRGYLLTDDQAYLDAHNTAMGSIDTTLNQLLAPAADRFVFLAGTPARLRTVVAAKMDELRRTVGLASQGRKAEALALVQSDRGERMMEDIRDVISLMRASNNGAVADSISAEQKVLTGLWFGITAAAIGIILLAAMLVRDARRRAALLREQGAALEMRNLALEAANVQLSDEIAQREAAEGQIRQMQKMEAIGQLSGGIAHDFNNMLAVIMSAISLIRRRLKRGDHDIEALLGGAADAAERAATLTARLLAFSRQQALAPEPIEANRLVSDMSELLRRTLGENIQMETVLAGGLWRTRIDPRQLENSIINLAVNARDAMPDGGRITIETANSDLDERYVRENPGATAGQHVMIAISDTGVGMPPEVIAKAFDPFFTTKLPGKGTGLGLSQVYGFVKQSQGHIKIYSEPGTGTTIKLYLPRYFGEEEAARRRPAAVELVGGTAGEIILVAEDEDHVRAMICDSLREVGYTVVDTGDAEEALGLLQERPDVALLLTDIVMPRMNGRVLAEEARRTRPELKVLYTTGFTRNAVVHNGVLDAGVNLIVKPFTVEQLAAKVREVLDAP